MSTPLPLTASKGPFYAKDSVGTLQRVRVVDLPGATPATNDIAGYAFVEATGSTYDYITGSYEELQQIKNNASLIDLNVTSIDNKLSQLTTIDSTLDSLNDNISDISTSLGPITVAIGHATASIDANTTYVEQMLKFQRGTNVFYKRFSEEDLFDLSVTSSDPSEVPPPNEYTLHMLGELNPAVSSTDRENYMSKAVQVIIQNSTNKNLYLSVSYNPAAPLSKNIYTVKIPPGVIYDSESQIAHIRHKIKFADDAYINPPFVGEVATSIVYNESINPNLMIGQTGFGIPYVSSVATNYYNMEFAGGGVSQKYVVAEWYFESGSTTSSFNGMTVSGQARVSYPLAPKNQTLKLYVTQAGNNTAYANLTASINSDIPTPFSLDYTSAPTYPTTGRYELIAELSGSGDIGDARVLWADLIRRKVTP